MNLPGDVDAIRRRIAIAYRKVVDAVTVDIADKTDELAKGLGIGIALDQKPVCSVQRGKIECRRHWRAIAKHDINRAIVGVCAAVGAVGADQKIVEPVAVDVPAAVDGNPCTVARVYAFNFKAVRSVQC